MLEPGITALAFTLPDKDRNMVSLSDFRGKKVVLYFYPRDGTPGCSRQAAAFAALYGEFQKKNAVVIGISQDSEESHQKFAEKKCLPFILLSDKNRDAAVKYEIWEEKKILGKIGVGLIRSTYIIDENGIIEHVLWKVNPETNAQDVLDLL